MRWIRRTRLKRLTGGIALAATILHVAFVSLHLAMMATLAFAGNANASQADVVHVICGPARLVPIGADLPAPAGHNGADDDPATYCPLCATGAATAALILPETPPQPAYTALDTAAPASVTPSPVLDRHETAPRQSRAPPTLT